MAPSRDAPSSCTQLPSDNASREDRTTGARGSSSGRRDDKGVETDSGGNSSGKALGGGQEMLHADSDEEEGEEKEEEEESEIGEESGADSRESNTAVKESGDGESTVVSPQASSIHNDDSIRTSLLTEYEPGRLAQRVFGTVTVLRRVLIKYREMEDQVRKLGKTSISDALKAQSENRNLRRQHKFLGDYWAREVKRLLDEKYDSTQRFREDVRKIYHECAENKQALEEEVHDLNEKLKDATMHCQILARQLRKS
ncbi:hypothetical protein BBP00_00009532 [Phytophthora kernoviae]|uniref:Uncharacterized protein n=1 Tax=Phytophthora kernoviae TaxID=325452 RepID=A0A3F2RCE5_9STRA|nr:hypothetical protein BBP00_00009532 [Phytophthora kernoviae]